MEGAVLLLQIVLQKIQCETELRLIMIKYKLGQLVGKNWSCKLKNQVKEVDFSGQEWFWAIDLYFEVILHNKVLMGADNFCRMNLHHLQIGRFVQVSLRRTESLNPNDANQGPRLHSDQAGLGVKWSTSGPKQG